MLSLHENCYLNACYYCYDAMSSLLSYHFTFGLVYLLLIIFFALPVLPLETANS